MRTRRVHILPLCQPLGNLARQADARGQRICLYYDGLNRLLGKHYRTDDNCPSSPTLNVSYGYDAAGYRTSMSDASGSTTWSYTARGLLAEIGDISRFEDASQLAAYAGLNPKGFRSGTSVNRKTRISKEGRAFFRYLLYMPAMVAMKHNSIVRSACERLAAHLKHPMELIVAAMKKLMHLVFGVLKHQQPFDPNYLLNVSFAS